MALAFPDVPDGESITISATAYLTWMRCPDRALARFEGHYDDGSLATFRGIVAHRVFARHLNEGAIADEDLGQACREEIGKGLNEAMVDIGLKPNGLAAMVEEIRVLYGRFQRLPSTGLQDVEVRLDDEVSPGLRLRGVVDAVFADEDGAVRLTDWKTGGLGDAALQLGFYAMLWTIVRGEMPHKLEAVSVASGERLEASPSAESLEDTATSVAGLATAVREALAANRRLTRLGGPWCRSCPVIEGCEEGATALSVLGR